MKKWKVEGYHGWSDYDGKMDDNLHMIIEMDDSVTKDELYALLQFRYRKDRVTAFHVEIYD